MKRFICLLSRKLLLIAFFTVPATALADFVSGHPPLTPAFVTRFLQLIRTTQSTFTPLVWLEQWIAEDGGITAEDAASRRG